MLSRIENENRPGYISYFPGTKRESRSRLPPSPSAAWAAYHRAAVHQFYLNTPLSHLLDSLCAPRTAEPAVTETFAENTRELVVQSVEQARAQVMADGSILPSNKNREIVALLHRWNIFKIKDSSRSRPRRWIFRPIRCTCTCATSARRRTLRARLFIAEQK